MKIIKHPMQSLRWCFPSEFSWRLYVVLQVAALLVLAFAMLEQPPLRIVYRYVYEDIEVDPAKVEAARARCAKEANHHGTGSDNFKWLLSPQETCFANEMPESRRVVGREVSRIDIVEGFLTMLLLAILGPFTAIRVPLWVWEGWRNG